MTKPNPDMEATYSHTIAYTSNIRLTVHPMCSAMSKASPAAGESAPTSPEVPQAHVAATLAIEALNVIEQWAASGRLDSDTLDEIACVLSDIENKAKKVLAELSPATPPAAGESPLRTLAPGDHIESMEVTPATPSAAVGADGPGAGDTVPRSEYDNLVELLYQIGDIAHDASTGPERPDTYWDIRQMAYGFREHVSHVDDSKPTNYHNPESEDTPPRGKDVLATGKPFLLKYGKRYVRREGQVSGELIKTMPGHECEESHPFLDVDNGFTYRPDGFYMSADWPHGLDLVSEYHDPEPSQTAESPDDWVMITDPKHNVRDCDWVSADSVLWRKPNDSLGNPIRDYQALQFRCRRKDLPAVPVVPKTRTVTLWEFTFGSYPHPYTYWAEVCPGAQVESTLTGRTCEVEVPE